MSTRSLTDHASAGGDAVVGSIVSQLPRRHVRTLAFWIAIALPFLHVPLLLAGVGSPARLQAYLGLLAMNVVALRVGHDYGR
jgi:hypothetical protein